MLHDAHGAPVVVLDRRAGRRARANLLQLAERSGLPGRIAEGDGWAAMSASVGLRAEAIAPFESAAGAARVVAVTAPFRLASREVFPEGTSVEIRQPGACGDTPVRLGNGQPLVAIAVLGELSHHAARRRVVFARLATAGVGIVHCGEVGERTSASPGAVDGRLLQRLREETGEAGLGLSIEVGEVRHLPQAVESAALLQVGGRNMQNFSLLRELGGVASPVLLKRGWGASVEELLLAAEYILSNGNGRVVACESGIRTFDAEGAPRFEINAVPLLKAASHLPVCADPCSAVTRPLLWPAVLRAGVAAGADAALVSVTPAERVSRTRGVDLSRLGALVAELRTIAAAVGRPE
jgi:3-deoxy-7-phosphoheptulonate synthase